MGSLFFINKIIYYIQNLYNFFISIESIHFFSLNRIMNNLSQKVNFIIFSLLCLELEMYKLYLISEELAVSQAKKGE